VRLHCSLIGLVLGIVAPAQSPEPPPQMQSVGVRRAVDGAGYSAPAAAKAKSNITRLLLNLQFRALQQTMRNSDCSGCSAHDRKGFEAELNQQFEAAAEGFRAALTCSPTVENRFAYGIALLLLDQPHAARRAFAEPPNTSSSLGSTGLALVLYQQGHSEAALNESLRIVEQEEAASLAGFVLLSIVGNPAAELAPEERTRLRRLSSGASQDAPLLAAEATMEHREHDDRAAQLLERAIQFDPTLAPAHILLGEIYTDRRQYDLAIEHYRAAISENGTDASLHYRLSQVYLLSGQRELGETELEAYRSMRKAGPESLSSDLKSLNADYYDKACNGSNR
jgi:tetratricopeptide (TPR) repeat protein